MVKIVSDLHSATDALSREVADADVLLLLGDLVNIIDYHAMDGILVDVYGTQAVAEVVEHRTQGRITQAMDLMASLRYGREQQFFEQFHSLMSAAYKKVSECLPSKTYLIGGNIDPPAYLEEMAGDSVEHADGKVFEIAGVKVGFVGGGLPTEMRVAGEVSEEQFASKLNSLGDVDVICTHVPPAIDEMTYDTHVKRLERGSGPLLEYIRDVRPSAAYFGHIHQPLVSAKCVGKTRMINAGYFRRTQRAVVMSA